MHRFKSLYVGIFSPFFFVSLSLSLFQYFSGTEPTSLTITNQCDDTVWPVVSPPAKDGPAGFSLSPGCSQTLTLAQSWSGLVWARTRCADSAGKIHCATGDLISDSGNPSPPATTAEFGSGGEYCVNVENGYNLPIAVVPASRSCAAAACSVDYRSTAYFTPELRVVVGDGASESVPVGVKSSCSAPAVESCNGDTSYSEIFKKLCPQARSSSASGDIGTVLCCRDSDFAVHFCDRGVSSGGDNRDHGSIQHAKGKYSIFGMNLEGKSGIIIGVVGGILGMVLISVVYLQCRKNECEPWTFSCCNLFSCTCCYDTYY